jgi:hypothetical protein
MKTKLQNLISKYNLRYPVKMTEEMQKLHLERVINNSTIYGAKMTNRI